MNLPVSRFLIARNNIRNVNSKGSLLISVLVCSCPSGRSRKARHSSVQFPSVPSQIWKDFFRCFTELPTLSCSAPETSIALFFWVFHSLPCQRNEASTTAVCAPVSACSQLMTSQPTGQIWANLTTTWGSRGSSTLSHLVLLLHERKACGLTHSSPCYKREGGWKLYSFCSDTALLTIQPRWSSRCSAGACSYAQRVTPWSTVMSVPSFNWRNFSHLCIRTLFFPEMENLLSPLEAAGTVCYLLPSFNSLLSPAANWALPASALASSLFTHAPLAPHWQKSLVWTCEWWLLLHGAGWEAFTGKKFDWLMIQLVGHSLWIYFQLITA